MRVLQIGFGAFGPTHLRAWLALGFAERLYLADPDPATRERARAFGLPETRIAADHRAFLAEVDIVDIVASLPVHAPLALEALNAGKHVFLEKPACANAVEAETLLARSEASGRVVQIGYLLRAHPLARAAKELLEQGAVGSLRYLTGDFVGFKRMRTDSGVVENDAVHVLDLLNWYVGRPPERVFAVVRDHFDRGLADLALVALAFPGGLPARVEASYIQPGALPDPIVPGAVTTKRVMMAGSGGALELDFQTNVLIRHMVRHERQEGVWRPCFAGSHIHYGEPADPVRVVQAEFEALLESIYSGRPVLCDVSEGALTMARLIEAIHASATVAGPVALDGARR